MAGQPLQSFVATLDRQLAGFSQSPSAPPIQVYSTLLSLSATDATAVSSVHEVPPRAVLDATSL